MTKLEEKLIELGYEYVGNSLTNCPRYYKCYIYNEREHEICIITSRDKNEIYYGAVNVYPSFETQQDIDNLQKAFNVLQQDLKELKKYDISNQ